VVRRHLKAIGSRWRKPEPARQALLVLAYPRNGETFEDLAIRRRPGVGPGSLGATGRVST
jgi:hypothetical protein